MLKSDPKELHYFCKWVYSNHQHTAWFKETIAGKRAIANINQNLIALITEYNRWYTVSYGININDLAELANKFIK